MSPDAAPDGPAPGRFLAACARRPVDRPPVWLMRQAGRYLPEYRAVREKAGGFLALCKTPELAAEVSLQPIRRFGFDAAIIFCDILIPAEAMGAEVAFEAGEGPRVRADVARLEVTEPRERCAFLYEALRLTKRALPQGTALLGFAGAPFTVACYLLEGETSRGFEKARARLLADPEAARTLLEKIARFTASYLAAQVEAGADAVQLFDTWAHLLGPDDAQEIAGRAARTTLDALRALLPRPVPVIYYGPPELGQHARADVFSLETRLAIAPARARLPVVQGNLDPVTLVVGPELTRARTRALLERAGPAPGYIFNLGHGVIKETPIASVEALVEEVRAWKA